MHHLPFTVELERAQGSQVSAMPPGRVAYSGAARIGLPLEGSNSYLVYSEKHTYQEICVRFGQNLSTCVLKKTQNGGKHNLAQMARVYMEREDPRNPGLYCTT